MSLRPFDRDSHTTRVFLLCVIVYTYIIYRLELWIHISFEKQQVEIAQRENESETRNPAKSVLRPDGDFNGPRSPFPGALRFYNIVVLFKNYTDQWRRYLNRTPKPRYHTCICILYRKAEK